MGRSAHREAHVTPNPRRTIAIDETITREDQKSRLDEFAAAPPPQSRGELVPAASYLPPERHGAIKVEVARSLADIRNDLAELGQLLGERGFYSWRVKDRKKGTTSLVEDVSIKGAMALMKAYGNCRVSCPVVVDLGTHWRFHAVFIDYEKGVEIERSFLQRKGIAGMGDDAARKEDMAYQIGISKAERNVVCKALEIEADILLDECKRSIVSRVGKNLEHYRQLIVDRASARGIELNRIEAVAGRPAKDWVATDMVSIIGRMAAITDGMATAEETFPKLGEEAEADERAMVGEKLDQFASAVVEDGTGPHAGTAAAPTPSSAPPEPVEGAAAPPPEIDIRKVQEDIVFRLMRLAQDKSLTVNERLESLEGLIIGLQDTLPGHDDFVNQAVNTAAKVAKGELLSVTAKKYLDGLMVPS